MPTYFKFPLSMNLKELNQKIQHAKREYGAKTLLEKDSKANPFEQFVIWLEEAITYQCVDPCAMTLATVDENSHPDIRIVLLGGVETDRLIFYSHYRSNKAKQLDKNNTVAVNFHWPALGRQIRIRGFVEKISSEKSQAYFKNRSRDSQLAVHAWQQSEKILNREMMETKIQAMHDKFKNTEISCPDCWGGYYIIPSEYEFFQGRDWRLHDRLHYVLLDNQWLVSRLAP